jgi:hypothetical protein
MSRLDLYRRGFVVRHFAPARIASVMTREGLVFVDYGTSMSRVPHYPPGWGRVHLAVPRAI